MATNKTIQPTNVTVQIPALSDVPDMSVPANAIDKTIDAVNALNSQLFTNKADTTLIDLVKTLNTGTYNFRLDNATDGPVSSGGVVYKVVKTHGENDTRCIITAMPMSSNTPVYSAFVGQNATGINWSTIGSITINRSAATTHNFTFPNQSTNLFMVDGQGGSRQYMALVYNSTNSLSIFQLAKGDNVTVANSGSTLGVTFNQSIGCTAKVINISGSGYVP